MGTISDKLMRVINTKEDIRQALISKGYDVPTSIPFKEYVKMILDLPCKADSFPDIEGIVARYSASGLTNEQMAANPVWVDKTGNGHDLQMKNFAWGGMSGVGGYVDNWNSSADWSINNYWVNSHTDHKLQLITASTVVQMKSNNIYNAENVYKNILNVNGLTEAVNKGSVGGLRISATDPITSKAIKSFSFKTDGIIQISFDDVLQDYFVAYLLYGNNTKDIDITIEQLPLYPGALVFDGVDDCGTCDNFPILTKEKGYTVVALRQWLSFQDIGYPTLVVNSTDRLAAFSFEDFRNETKSTWNWGRSVELSDYKIPLLYTYQTSTSYNSKTIFAGATEEGSNILQVCRSGSYCANAAIWEIVILDHDATEEELTKIKDYFVKTYPWLFPDQAWTVVGKTNEDEDRATIANITGNGNDLVLSNFGFAEGSGYGLYGQNYISYAITNRAVYTKTNSSIHVTKSITAGVNFTESARNVTIPSYRIKVTGIQSGQEMIYRGSNNTFLTNIPSDGTYVLPAVENGSNLGFQFVSYTGDCDITIEQIPEYEGYLVTDGVDDEVRSAAFTLNKDWTIVGNWEFITNENKNAGLTKVYSFYLYNRDYGIFVYKYTNAGQGFSVEDVKSLKAICSDGRIYLNDWQEIRNNIEQEATISKGVMAIGYFNRDFTKVAFKNLGIYNNQLLSKDECIKAYNYLQTLKSK